MNQNQPITKEQIRTYLPPTWDCVVSMLYQCYDGRGAEDTPQIMEQYRILADCTKDLPFDLQDRISTATVALCVEHERIAFEDGIAIGAKWILEILNP